MLEVPLSIYKVFGWLTKSRYGIKMEKKLHLDDKIVLNEDVEIFRNVWPKF